MSELENAASEKEFKDKEYKLETFESPAETLEENCEILAKFGGFDFLESAIDGVQNMNPERKARKNIFLKENDKKAERKDLKAKLKLWVEVLQSSDNLSEMTESCSAKSTQAAKVYKKNVKKALEETKDLETAWRGLNLFYKNTESDKLKNLTIMNASKDQLTDLDNSRFIDSVAEELKSNFDRLDLRDNYSLLVLPGYLGSNKVVDKWAKIAYENKVMLVTDFEHLDFADDVIESFESANLTSADMHKSNVMMAGNWLVGRGKYDEVNEGDDLYVPPSTALAGKLYTTLMSQVTAGKKHGGMNEVDAVKFDLKKSEISNLDKIGLIPMVNEYGKVMAFSAKTLFNGDNLGLQTYSVVRVFDYISKVLVDFLNRRAFENWTSKTEQDLRSQIVKFLETIKGPDNLIESFQIMRLERDENVKDKIHLDIHITPYFPAKSFMVKLDGQKGESAEQTWNTSYEQQK
jgi:hypothetical protein